MQGISNSRGQIQLPTEVYLALMYEQCKNTLMSFTAVLGDKIWRNLNEPAWSLNLLKWEEEQKRNSFVCQKVFFLFRALCPSRPSSFQMVCFAASWMAKVWVLRLRSSCGNPLKSYCLIEDWICLSVDEEETSHSRKKWRRQYKDAVPSL